MRLIAQTVHVRFFIAVSLTSTLAHAESYRVDVDHGSDVASCGVAAPCKSYGFLAAQGCGGAGCLSQIQTDLSTPGKGARIQFACAHSGGACTGTAVYEGNGAGRPLCFGFDGREDSSLTVECVDGAGNYAPQKCEVHGENLTYASQSAVVVLGGAGPSCLDDTASYLEFRGFRITHIGNSSAQSGIRVRAGGQGPSHHLRVADNYVDGSANGVGPYNGAVSDLMMVLGGTSYFTYVSNVFTNCAPGGTFGCASVQQPAQHIAAIGNRFGPRQGFPGPYGGFGSNIDCNTWQGVSRGLIDGNECFKTADGLDNGMLDANKIENIIVRYNDLHDVHGNQNAYGSRLAKISGDQGSNTPTGAFTFYKNVFRHTDPAYWDGAVWVTELARDVDFWNNTIFGGPHKLDDTTIQTFAYGANGVEAVRSHYSIFDGTTVNNPTGDCQGVTGKTCPLWLNGNPTCTAGDCAWTGNRLWFQERGGDAPCIYSTAAGQSAISFKCDLSRTSAGPDFNGIGSNSGNLRADPHFVNRGGQNLEDFRITVDSTDYRDKGGSFCTTTSAGTGNVVTVTCNGLSTSPGRYFPDPRDYYNITNSDCKGRGVRAFDGVNPGCFDVQIEGCGVRQIVALDAQSITLSSACNWTGGAKVHVPWYGAAPDVGAFEYAPERSSVSSPVETGEVPTPTGSQDSQEGAPDGGDRRDLETGCTCHVTSHGPGTSPMALALPLIIFAALHRRRRRS